MSLISAIKWIKNTINCFSETKDKNIIDKIIVRLSNILKLKEILKNQFSVELKDFQNENNKPNKKPKTNSTDLNPKYCEITYFKPQVLKFVEHILVKIGNEFNKDSDNNERDIYISELEYILDDSLILTSRKELLLIRKEFNNYFRIISQILSMDWKLIVLRFINRINTTLSLPLLKFY